MKYLVGIDIGGTNLRTAVISEDGNIVETYKVCNEVSKGPQYNLDKLISHIKNNFKKYDIEKVGVGSPGPLDLRQGKLLNPPNLKGWENFNIKEYLSKGLDITVNVNNDANVAGLAESVVGAAKGAESVFFITVSTGTGGGLIFNNKIVNGAHSSAAEIFNMIINEDEYVQPGLNKSSLEGQCSGVNIARIASEVYGEKLSTKEVFDLYMKKDEKIVKVINNWVDNFSTGIANIMMVVDPEVFVLGGAVIINNDYLLPLIIESVKKKVSNPDAVNIKTALLGDNAGLIGAAML